MAVAIRLLVSNHRSLDGTSGPNSVPDHRDWTWSVRTSALTGHHHSGAQEAWRRIDLDQFSRHLLLVLFITIVRFGCSTADPFGL